MFLFDDIFTEYIGLCFVNIRWSIISFFSSYLYSFFSTYTSCPDNPGPTNKVDVLLKIGEELIKGTSKVSFEGASFYVP